MKMQSEHNVALPDPPVPPAPIETPPSTPPETPPGAPPEVPQPDPAPQPGDAPAPRADFYIRYRLLRRRCWIIRRQTNVSRPPDRRSS